MMLDKSWPSRDRSCFGKNTEVCGKNGVASGHVYARTAHCSSEKCTSFLHIFLRLSVLELTI